MAKELDVMDGICDTCGAAGAPNMSCMVPGCDGFVLALNEPVAADRTGEDRYDDGLLHEAGADKDPLAFDDDLIDNKQTVSLDDLAEEELAAKDDADDNDL